MDDVRKVIYTILILFVVVVLGFISFIYISGCGFTLTCPQGQPLVIRTPIPTLIPATLPAPDHTQAQVAFNKCQVAAVDLIGAWVSAHYPENDKFTFTDVKSTQCEGPFKKDVQPLFTESNIWYAGSPACDSCHQPDLAKAMKNMDLSSYAGILAGSGRANGEPQGKDILGGGNWDQALLHQMLYAPNGQTTIGRPAMPFGRPADVPANGPLVYAGAAITGAPTAEASAATPTAPAVAEEIARPSNPGGPGQAIDITGNADLGSVVFTANCVPCHGVNGVGGIPNPGSDDGTVPPLNPIDPTLISSDYKTYATNLDLFIEHGSTPAGPAPVLNMIAWGDKGTLTPHQISDVIAFLIRLNPAPASDGSVPTVAATEVPASDIARPSNPGGPSQAIDLAGNAEQGSQVFASNCVACHGAQGVGGILNPGSDDGTVPELNPIDPTLKSADYKTFATNLDLFIEHGSTPAGDSPVLTMPAWGDRGFLTLQQIADVIAYLISLNP